MRFHWMHNECCTLQVKEELAGVQRAHEAQILAVSRNVKRVATLREAHKVGHHPRNRTITRCFLLHRLW
jgi:hypothetical protein